MPINIDERIKKKVEVVESIITGPLDEVLKVIKEQRRTGHLILSFSYGTEVGKKFERIEKTS